MKKNLFLSFFLIAFNSLVFSQISYNTILFINEGKVSLNSFNKPVLPATTSFTYNQTDSEVLRNYEQDSVNIDKEECKTNYLTEKSLHTLCYFSLKEESENYGNTLEYGRYSSYRYKNKNLGLRCVK